MLRITQKSDAGAAKSYYSQSDYYVEQELPGQWRGKAARRLGLEGEIKKGDWDALCDNVNPRTGKRLTARQRSDRSVCYDFTFNCPKSVSLLFAATQDKRVLDAFQGAVNSTLDDIEAEMATRVRKDGRNEDRIVGNMAAGVYTHFLSRPVDGIADPHLHSHAVILNFCHDDKENQFKACQFRGLKRDARYFEAVFHSRLAERLWSLGLPIERTKQGWELGGIRRPLIEKFSRRTALIEEMAREKGIDNPEEKAELGAKTRERKSKDLTLPELQDVWRSKMSAPERDVLEKLADTLGGDASTTDPKACAKAIEHAIDHVFERRSVVPERDLLAAALRQSVGQATVEQMMDAAERCNLITGERDGRRMVTTHGVLDEERKAVEFARAGRGTCRPIAAKHGGFKREWLNAAQKRAVKHIVESRDRIMIVRGAAGTGKTTLMQEAVEAVEASGTKVFAFAPSADASRGTLRDAGFKDADTVARLLIDEKLQRQAAGQLIWIDEAGLLSMRDVSEVFALADRLDARILLSGDRRQHGSVNYGAPLKLLEEQAGLVPAEVKEIQRQSGAYKEAVKALSDGRAAEGFRRLDELGWIREISTADRYRQLAADYVETVLAGKQALVISPTHFEKDRLSAEIRRELKDKGKLGGDEREFTVLENANLTEAERRDKVNFGPRDVICFHQNAKGFTRGDRVSVKNQRELPLDQAKRFQLFHTATLKLAPGDMVRITHNGFTADGKHRLNNGALYKVNEFDDRGNIVLDNGWTIARDWGFLDHGFVVTSHQSQSKTVDRVFVGQASDSYAASSREQFYVSVSRARQQVVVYTDDKAALLDAVIRSDDRLTATELIDGSPRRLPEQLRDQYHDMAAERLREEIDRER
jgi:conjugative relaxase-like TrwC/TraI family protein